MGGVERRLKARAYFTAFRVAEAWNGMVRPGATGASQVVLKVAAIKCSGRRNIGLLTILGLQAQQRAGQITIGFKGRYWWPPCLLT